MTSLAELIVFHVEYHVLKKKIIVMSCLLESCCFPFKLLYFRLFKVLTSISHRVIDMYTSDCWRCVSNNVEYNRLAL